MFFGGRLALGLGAGWNEQEVRRLRHRAGWQRSDRFEEACEMLIGLLSPQETITFKGSCYELTDARCNPKPAQQPHPPICIGGSGEKRRLRTAARFAQHWNFDSGSSGARDVLHQHRTDVGRDPAEILLSGQVQFTGDLAATGRNSRGSPRGRRGARDRLLASAVHTGRAGAAYPRVVGAVLSRPGPLVRRRRNVCRRGRTVE
ncbi:LLM class flavin-dependent oxidoreductase [Streptomyces sp. NRRL S-1824]|uniref:LLM class flavin-dependent oxidoreductase n=1 Tax=Streptomyces sp. NRRL S-1824 TaxID=1463889 RepID=UPI001900DCC0